MRPRGPSSSSPSTWYVGQVAVQKPQCTHLRRMASASSPAGVFLNSGASVVCMERLQAGVHPSRIEDPGGIERFLQLAMDVVERRLQRREHAARLVAGAKER